MPFFFLALGILFLLAALALAKFEKRNRRWYWDRAALIGIGFCVAMGLINIVWGLTL